MTNLLRGNFNISLSAEPQAQEGEREAFRRRALESISGSMVFVEDALIWWDIADE